MGKIAHFGNGAIEWHLAPADRDFLTFVQEMIRFRRAHPVLRRRRFFQGRRILGGNVKDVLWFDSNGKEMTDETWNAVSARCLGVRLAGDAIEEPDDRGRRVTDDTLLILLNAHDQTIPFTLPQPGHRQSWTVVVDTAESHLKRSRVRRGYAYALQGRSLVVLMAPRDQAR